MLNFKSKKNRFKKVSFGLFLILFLTMNLGGALLLAEPAEAMHCACHVVSDTSSLSVFRTAKVAFDAAMNALNKTANVSLLGLYMIDHTLKFLAEILKTRLINSLTRETINFIQGKTDGQLKFVTDLKSYLRGPNTFENLPAALSATIENSDYPVFIKEIYKDFYQAADLDLASSSKVGSQKGVGPSYKQSEDGVYEMDWDNLAINSFDINSTADPRWATLNAYLTLANEAEKQQEEKKLLYLAGQGFAPQTLDLGGEDFCLVNDLQGNCIVPSTFITTPGKVFSSMLANIADAHIKRIVNAENLEDFLVIVANSFIDKLVGSKKSGLLGLNMGTFASSTSDEFTKEDSTKNTNKATDWLMWKMKSRALIQTKILTTLRELKKCLASKGDEIMIKEVDKNIKDFETKLETMNKRISLLEMNYAAYDPREYGTVDAAKKQYEGLETSADEFSAALFQCAKTADDDTVTNWVAIKQKSYDIIMQAPGGIIYYIDKFIDYHRQRGESTSYWQAKKESYANLANEIHKDIEAVRANPLAKHSSVESAKSEYNSLNATLNNYKKEWENLINNNNGGINGGH